MSVTDGLATEREDFAQLRAENERLRHELESSRRELGEMQDRLRLAHVAGKAGTFDWFMPENRIMWSPELEQLYGVPAGGFEGAIEHWIKRVHPDDSARVLAEIEQTLAQKGTDYNYEFRAVLSDGTERWLRGQARFFYGAQGEPFRMVGINVDIHERRQEEAALIRTEKLAAVGRLAASIAHEINNPLAGVTNLLYLARNSNDIPEVHDFLDVADRELRRVSAISQQTLRFYRQATNPVLSTAEGLFEPVLSVHQGRFVNSKVRVEKRYLTTRPVLCFEGEIGQVLSNLIGNAIDALHPLGGRLVVEGREGTEWKSGKRGLWLTVGDDGPGITKAHSKRLFEPFFTTKGIGGTGLGLWVSQEIAKRHQGVLRFRSKTDPDGRSGTIFRLFLPFDPAMRT